MTESTFVQEREGEYTIDFEKLVEIFAKFDNFLKLSFSIRNHSMCDFLQGVKKLKTHLTIWFNVFNYHNYSQTNMMEFKPSSIVRSRRLTNVNKGENYD